MENVKHKHREGKMIVLENGELKIKSTELVDIINDFRKVEAGAIGKTYTELAHYDFYKKIKKELDTLKSVGVSNDGNISEITYLDSKNRIQPCFELNRDGMLQMLNSESVLVRYKTIEYINKLEEQVKGQVLNTSELSPELQMFKQIFDSVAKQQLEAKETKRIALTADSKAEEAKEEIQAIRDVVAINTSTVSWREECRKLIVKMAHSLGGNKFISDVNREIYDLMRIRLKCKLDVQLTNMRRRMADEGVCKSKRDKLNYLDVIARDSRLIEGYVAIVKELAIKYGA